MRSPPRSREMIESIVYRVVEKGITCVSVDALANGKTPFRNVGVSHSGNRVRLFGRVNKSFCTRANPVNLRGIFFLPGNSRGTSPTRASHHGRARARSFWHWGIFSAEFPPRRGGRTGERDSRHQTPDISPAGDEEAPLFSLK